MDSQQTPTISTKFSSHHHHHHHHHAIIEMESKSSKSQDDQNNKNPDPILQKNGSDHHRHHEVEVDDYSKRGQWLRAAVLGANDGLLSTASLMMGVGAVRADVKTMVLTGIAGLVGGACSMALGEFVSVYSQYDIELAQLKRENNKSTDQLEVMKKGLPSPLKAAAASALAFAVGAFVPLLAAAFVKSYHARLGAMVATVSFALFGFGGLGAYLGRAPFMRSSLRVLVGGWMAMGITFGITKLIGNAAV